MPFLTNQHKCKFSEFFEYFYVLIVGGVDATLTGISSIRPYFAAFLHELMESPTTNPRQEQIRNHEWKGKVQSDRSAALNQCGQVILGR